MAEFGINATNLSAPQGAGANPVQGVQTPASHPLAYSIPGGIVEVLGAGVKTLFEKPDPGAEILKKFTRENNSIGDALSQGAITASEAIDRKQALFRQYSSNYPELIKPMSEIGGWINKNAGFEQAESQIQQEREREDLIRKRAFQAGFLIDDNTPPAEREAILDFVMELDHSTAKLEYNQKRLNYAAGHNSYTQDLIKQDFEREIKDTTLRLADTMFTAFNAKIESLVLRSSSGEPGFNPESALQEVAALSAQMNAEVAKLEIYDPARATAIRRVLDQYTANAEKMFDPRVSAEVREGMIKSNMNAAKIAILGDNQVLTNAAIQDIFKNTDVLALQNGELILNTSARLMATYDNPFAKVPTVVGMGDAAAEKGVYTGIKQAVDAVKNGSIPGLSEEESLGRIASGVNNVLEQFGGLVNSRNARPNDYVAALDLIASPQFKEIVKAGKLDPDAAANAEIALQYGFRESRAVRGTFNEALRKTYQTPRPTSSVASAVIGEGETFEYIDVVAPRFDKASGTVSFGIDPSFQGSMLARQGVNTIIKEFDNNKQAFNISIRAHANLLGMDVGEYWEQYKHEIFPEYYPDPEVLKPGHVDEGLEYIGGPPGRKSSWRPATNRNDNGTE